MDSRRGDNTLASAARGLAARDRRSASTGAIQDAIGDEIGRSRPATGPAPVAAPTLTPAVRQRHAIRGQLLSRATLRQAMILSEILAPPKGLRRLE